MLNPSELRDALTFDDVLLLPLKSQVLPHQAETHTALTANIRLNIPLVSAAMDTVTESRLAIVMAQLGGLGIIHKNMTLDQQVVEVTRVKKSESGMVVDPITLGPDQKISEAIAVMNDKGISGLPVTEKGKLVGILTNRDLRFQKNLNALVRDVMTSQNLITVTEKVTLEEAKDVLQKHRIEKLLVVDKHKRLTGLITVKDIEKTILHPHAVKDKLGRLRVGAAIGVGEDGVRRAEALFAAGVDLVVVDTAHGHSQGVLDTVKVLRKTFPKADIVAGNIATKEAARDLIAAGASALKVGVGPGSICTTRVITGVGVPQITAIADCVSVAREKGIPVISDGGIKFSGDIVKALAAGANTVMIGSLFAGTDEAPGMIIMKDGKRYKKYMGSASYDSGHERKELQEGKKVRERLDIFVEGVSILMDYKGVVEDVIHSIIKGVQSAMSYSGARNIMEMHQNTELIQLTSAGWEESKAQGMKLNE